MPDSERIPIVVGLAERIARLEKLAGINGPLPPVETPEQITEGVEKIVAASGPPQFSPPVATPNWGDVINPDGTWGSSETTSEDEAEEAAPATTDSDEPMPDGLARIVPTSLDLLEQKAWAAQRMIKLYGQIFTLKSYTPAEYAEWEQLTKYQGWFN